MIVFTILNGWECDDPAIMAALSEIQPLINKYSFHRVAYLRGQEK